MKILLPSLKNIMHDIIYLDIAYDKSGLFSNVGNVMIHFVDEQNYHVNGYYLISIDSFEGLCRVRGIHDDEYEDEENFIEGLDLIDESQLKVIGVDIL